MPKRKSEKWTAKDTGPYVDNARGIYMGERVQQIATDEGWPGEFLDADDKFYQEATDEAEEWLNSNLAEDEYYFGMSEAGNWGYWEIEDE